MNTLRHTILKAWAAGILTAWLAATAIAQTTANSTPDASASETAEEVESLKPRQAIEYVGPDTYILLDAEGRPQPVLGMRYEEFVAAWKRMQQADERETKPRFTIEDLQLAGAVAGEQAELKIEILIRPLVTGSIGVPLGMADAVLIERPTIVSTDEAESAGRAEPGQGAKSFVAYDPKSGGYVAWIDGPSEQRWRVLMTVSRPLVRNGNETSLALNLPRALVSRLALELPQRTENVTASEGAVKAQSNTSSGSSRLEVQGPRGDFRLKWTAAEGKTDETASVISATGAVGVTIDGHSVRSDARLLVRSYGGSFDRIQVRLPPGAQLIEEPAPGAADTKLIPYRIHREPSRIPLGDVGSSLVTVEFDEPQTGPVEVRMSTEQPLGWTGEDSSVELAGFEVVGAVRQFGDVAIAVADDWQLRFKNGPYVRQIERGELDDVLRALQPTAAFQYDRQPYSLPVAVVSRPMVVHVTPEYTLRLAADQAELRTLLHYQVPGARAFEFRVQLNGWELTEEPIGSNGLVDRDRAVVRRDGVLSMPLGQASARRAEVAFTLRRAMPSGSGPLDLPLPAPEADIVLAGDLAVIADANVELVPDVASSRGLAAVPVSRFEQTRDSAAGGEIFSYRTFTADASFAARWSVRERAVHSDVFTRLSLDWQRAQAIQDVEYEVLHQPLAELAVEVPAGWSIVDNQLQLLPENAHEAPIVANLAVEPESHGRPTQIARAILAQPRIGRFRVRMEYAFDALEDAGDDSASYMNLPRPVATRVDTHRVETRVAPDMTVAVVTASAGGWRVDENSNGDDSLTLTSRGENDTLPIEVRSRSAARAPTTVVERVWLQTWQAGNTIQDRAAIRFRTSDTAAIVELPPNSIAANIEVLLDGSLAESTAVQEGRLVVALPGSFRQVDDRPNAHTLELRYRRAAPAGLVTQLAVTPPQLVGSTGLCDVFWHVVLPGDRHVVGVPENLFTVDAGQWLELVFGSDAGRSQAELEEWVGASSQAAPATTQNEYVYGGLAPVSMATIAAPRWLIVLAASGLVLVLTLAWLYLPAARRGWIAVVVATAIAGLACAFPAPAILAGQAAILGLALGATSLWLERWRGTRKALMATTAATPAVAGSTNLRMRSSQRTDSYYAPPTESLSNRPERHSTSATPTAPLVVPEMDR